MNPWHPWWTDTFPGVPPHFVFEVLAVVVGLTLALRKRQRAPSIPLPVVVCGLVGAVLGARLLGCLIDPVETWALRATPGGWLQQKTVVGGILGGWVGVVFAHRRLGFSPTTAAAFVPTLALVLAIGRLGCFFSGVSDRTHGLPSSLPWALDLGDGITRHPLALYEIGVLLVLAGVLSNRRHPAHRRWCAFVLLYMAWRFASAPLAPLPPLVGPVTTIQLAAAVGMGWAARALWRTPHPTPATLSPSGT